MTRHLGVLSDSHGNVEAWDAACALFGAADGILHAGDVLAQADTELADRINDCRIPVVIARGNADGGAEKFLRTPLLPLVSLFWEGRTVLLAHGTDFPTFRTAALRARAALAISGHTHIATLVREEETIFLNPGSCSLPLGRDPASVAMVFAHEIRILTLSGDLLHLESW
jgi:putative phosphoesterase